MYFAQGYIFLLISFASVRAIFADESSVAKYPRCRCRLIIGFILHVLGGPSISEIKPEQQHVSADHLGLIELQ